MEDGWAARGGPPVTRPQSIDDGKVQGNRLGAMLPCAVREALGSKPARHTKTSAGQRPPSGVVRSSNRCGASNTGRKPPRSQFVCEVPQCVVQCNRITTSHTAEGVAALVFNPRILNTNLSKCSTACIPNQGPRTQDTFPANLHASAIFNPRVLECKSTM